jgi:hypothetical protein
MVLLFWSSVQKRGVAGGDNIRRKDRNVHWRTGLSLEATRRAVDGRNMVLLFVMILIKAIDPP